MVKCDECEHFKPLEGYSHKGVCYIPGRLLQTIGDTIRPICDEESIFGRPEIYFQRKEVR